MPPVLVAGLLHSVDGLPIGARAYRMIWLLLAPLNAIVQASIPATTVDATPLTLAPRPVDR